jgi:hypothetical protein
MNIPKLPPQLLSSGSSFRPLSKSGTGPVKSPSLGGEKLISTRQEEFEAMDTFVNRTLLKSVTKERAQVPQDATYSRSEAKGLASTLKSMVAISSRPVTGEKVTVSSTGALFMESEPQPQSKAWQPSSLSEAVDYRKSCVEKHKQTIEVLVDARAQGNVPESHLKDLEQTMLAADRKVFEAMKMCDQF